MVQAGMAQPALAFFDCNCFIGRTTAPLPTHRFHVEDLLEEMDWCGIARALVTHSLSKEYDPRFGNERVVRETKGRPQLCPCYVLLPPATKELPPPERLLQEMAEVGARAVRLFPRQHNYSLSEWGAGALLEFCAENALPVFLDLEETDWQQIEAVCAAFPTLQLTLLRIGYRADRFFFPLLERHEGLRLEVSYYQAHRGLEEVVARFGPERLVYGSGWPHFSPGAGIAAVLYAEISDSDKAKIAAGNLERLLKKW